MKSKFLVCQFDESLNKISHRGQMDLHIRYIDEDNIVQTKYVTSAFLGKATAADLLRAFKSCLPGTDMIEKVVQLGMDGPNVNLKMFELFKEEMSELPGRFQPLDIGSCGIHVVHGAFKMVFRNLLGRFKNLFALLTMFSKIRHLDELLILL